jgi:hypothetical protein
VQGDDVGAPHAMSAGAIGDADRVLPYAEWTIYGNFIDPQPL